MNIKNELKKTAEAAKHIASLTTEEKDNVLMLMAFAIEQNKLRILEENQRDLEAARAANMSVAMLDRLTLNEERLTSIVRSVESIAMLDDPVGVKRSLGTQDNGLQISKLSVPIGVVGMIYEARPNVAAEAAALCFKSGNGVVLRCGKEAMKTSAAIVEAMQSMLVSNGVMPDAIKLITDPDRELILALIQQEKYLDVVIPRGGEGLIRFVTENSKVPVIQHYRGVCHLYVDEYADMQQALDLFVNGKTQRPGVCNALECLLVHEKIAERFLSQVQLFCGIHKIKVNACHQSYPYFSHQEDTKVIQKDKFGKEYLSREIAVRIVPDLGSAIAHIDEFGSRHTEVICTEDESNAELFQRMVDASVVMVNASSRFADGGQLGLGAEIGIATTKLHAYGPMGLESLTTEKFLVNGSGQVRA